MVRPMPRRLSCLFAFLTRVPLPCHNIEEAARGYPLVPLVGLFEGLVVAIIMSLTDSAIVAGSLGLVAHLWVTGGLHLDGFADYSDAVGAGATGQKAIEIMKDPRRGSFALSYMTVIITARFAGLVVLHSDWAAITAGYVVAAESMYLASLLLPKPGHQGLGQLFYAYGVTQRGKIINAILSSSLLLSLAYFSPIKVVSATIAGSIVTVLAASDAKARLGYASGDVLGFVYEATLTASLLAEALVANPAPWW